MKSRQAEDTPNTKKAYYANDETGGRVFHSLDKRSMSLVTFLGQQDQVCHSTSKNKHTMQGQGQQKKVKISVIAFPNAIANPGAMMIKSLDTIVAYGTMRGPRGSENFTGKTVFQFDADILDHDFFGSGWGTVGGPVGAPVGAVVVLHLAFYVGSLGFGRPRDDPGVTE